MTRIRHTPVAPTRAQFLQPGGVIDAHRHDDHQLVYAGRGALAVTTDAGSWAVPDNAAIWVPAGTVHAHRAFGNLELHLVGVPTAENPLDVHRPTVITVGPLLRELIITYTRDLSDTPERARLLAVLLDQLRTAHQQPQYLPAPTQPPLLAIAQIFQTNPADHRTLAELGRATGSSERTLSRLFQSDVGMSFPQWRTQLRMQHAVILLAKDTPVTSVAHQCGWSSASAFIDAFRRAFGETPGRYR
jgi:AraC-like DNA-binding protein/quercetin dioxygenase-like cupin family protein